ncbi:MAG: hypothetical protein EOO20_00195 [Chryseobacterium sp.]|nr:MAG: hypothetical protein EOO20_00195 [Chryseobacterium sp.]
MKYLLMLLVLFSSELHAQKLEILLIGVSHNYSSYPKQDFADIYRKIEQFKPTAFFGEFLSKADEQNVMDYWCKKDNLHRLKILRQNRNIPAVQLPKAIDSLNTIIKQKPDDFKSRTDLAHAYYLNEDVANGHYQYWQVFDHLQQHADADLSTYVDKLLSPKLDTTGRSMKRLITSEYALIAFPMMRKLGMTTLFAMDCQDYDLNWNASWAAVDEKFAAFRKDTTKVFQNELNSHFKSINDGFKRYDEVEKSSSKVTEWLNTPEASIISASGDFYLPEMYDMKNFPKVEMRSKIHWWIMRNQGMCNNVIHRAKATGARKVVVIAGANHRKYMQDIFEHMPGVKVQNINQLN